MEIRHIMHTARSATIEIADGGRYFTKQPVELRVNGEPSLTTEKTITSLFDLKPDQKYVVEAYVNGEKQGEVSFKTDYEYVTLDVTRSVPRVTGNMTIPTLFRLPSWHVR